MIVVVMAYGVVVNGGGKNIVREVMGISGCLPKWKKKWTSGGNVSEKG